MKSSFFYKLVFFVKINIICSLIARVLPYKILPSQNSSSKIAIITVAFNKPELIWIQWMALCRYTKEKFVYLIIDNSTSKQSSDKISNFCLENNIFYAKALMPSVLARSPSVSHAAALNMGVKLACKYIMPDYLVVLDHDIFPGSKFSIAHMLFDYEFIGLPQFRGLHQYYWPGLLFMNMTKIDVNKLDFFPVIGADTGAKLRSQLMKQNIKCSSLDEPKYYSVEDNCVYLSRCDGPAERLLSSNLLIEEIQGWLHLINGSGWRGVSNDKLRLDYIKNLLFGFG
jgi:hypothetical protein